MISLPIRTTTIVPTLEEFIPLAHGRYISEWGELSAFWCVSILTPESIDDYLLPINCMDPMYQALHNGNLSEGESPFNESQDENQF